MSDYEYEKNQLDGIGSLVEEAAERTGEFFEKAFHDMKESAKAQHEVDKANLEAVKAENKALWEDAKLSPKARQEKNAAHTR